MISLELSKFRATIHFDPSMLRKAGMVWWPRHVARRFRDRVLRVCDRSIILRREADVNDAMFVDRWHDYSRIAVLGPTGIKGYAARAKFHDRLCTEYDQLDAVEQCLCHWLEFDGRFGVRARAVRNPAGRVSRIVEPSGTIIHQLDPDVFMPQPIDVYRRRCVSCKLLVFRDPVPANWSWGKCPRCGHL